MPHVKSVIHQYESNSGFRPYRQLQCAKESPPPLLHDTSQRLDERRLKNNHAERADTSDGEVANDVPKVRLNALAKRPPSFLPSQENKGPKNQWAGNPYGNASHRSRYLLAQIAVFPSKLPASITIMSAERNAPASAGASGGRSRVLARPTMGALANNMRKGRSIPDAS